MLEQNPNEAFDILTFQFEMLGVDEVARDLSSKLKTSVKKIYSAEGKLSDDDLKKVDAYLELLSKYPISVVDNLGNVSEIKDTILYYVSTNNLIRQKRGLIITIDHSLLVKSEDGESEKQTLDRLMHCLVLLKKYLTSMGCKVMFFVLSQLNRDIETTERVTNPKLHYPNKNDLFGASSVYYSSDYVIIIHRPAQIEGLGNWYGPSKHGWPNGLPVFNPSNPSQPMIYLHVIKERFGHNKIISMLDELKHANITEYDLN
jgi:replicative DNA helicase